MMTKAWENKPLYWQWPNMPAPPGGNVWSRTEKASWITLTDRIGYVRGGCGKGMGYALIGDNWGVAVAAWGTDSEFDRVLGDWFRNEGAQNATNPMTGPLDAF